MHYFKHLVSGFSLGVLFTIETAFYATPPTNAQPIPDYDCALYAVGYVSGGLGVDTVSNVTGVMQGPAHSGETITDMLQATGHDRINYQTYYSREALFDYLRANGDGNYIVGWRRNEDPRGHVVNARTIGRTTVFIDNQCQRFTEPPTGLGYVYYAWFVEPLRFSDDRGDPMDLDRNDPMDIDRGEPMDLDKRDAMAGSSGGFTSSCQNITLFTNTDRFNSVYLNADCRNNVGTFTPTAIDLNSGIINSFGGLVWQENGGFGGSVRNCQLMFDNNVTVLKCEANDGNGSWKKAGITLDKRIANDNGRLAVRL